MAIDRSGIVIQMRVISRHETISFGAVISEKDSSWIAAFNGRPLENPHLDRWQLRSDEGVIDGITGATVTASVLVRGVFRAFNYIDSEQLALAPSKTTKGRE